jgi:tryptophanyl-tRNA synthetase
MLSGEVKKEATAVIQKIIGDFQERRKTITDETLEKFTAIRKLDFDF